MILCNLATHYIIELQPASFDCISAVRSANMLSFYRLQAQLVEDLCNNFEHSPVNCAQTQPELLQSLTCNWNAEAHPAGKGPDL